MIINPGKALPSVLLVAATVACFIAVSAVSGCYGSGQDQTGTYNDTICAEDIDLTGTEFVTNSDFQGGTADWQKVENSEAGTNTVTGESKTACGYAASFVRENAGGATGLIALEQTLKIEKAQTPRLKLQMLMRIDYQLLTSDGVLGGETPVFISLDYQTATGETRSYAQGFMVRGSQINYPDRDQNIMPLYWSQYNIDDVFGKIPEAVRITKVAVGGNGQDFHSFVALVSLRGK